MIENDYAMALYEAGSKSSNSDLLQNLRALLKRRLHERLLPRIYSEYRKLILKEERLKNQKHSTPQKERTRILLELYRKLMS